MAECQNRTCGLDILQLNVRLLGSRKSWTGVDVRCVDRPMTVDYDVGDFCLYLQQAMDIIQDVLGLVRRGYADILVNSKCWVKRLNGGSVESAMGQLVRGGWGRSQKIE
jgi:hypothetical protein